MNAGDRVRRSGSAIIGQVLSVGTILSGGAVIRWTDTYGSWTVLESIDRLLVVAPAAGDN